MSGEGAPPPAGKNGLLCGSRTKSYGSLVRSPVRQRRVEHNIQPEDTLQGLSLKYGVSMEQIKRANRLYTNESIFLKKSLSIPVPSDLDPCGNWVDLVAEGGEEDGSGRRASASNDITGSSSERKPNDGKEQPSDLTPVDFLKRLDDLISQSKQAATKGCQDAEKRVAAIEAACTSGTSDWRPLTKSQSDISSLRVQQQQASYVAVPLTITKLTKKLRDGEDEIFHL